MSRKYVEYLLSLYKAKFPYNGNTLVLTAVHALDVPQVLHFDITVMSKFSHANFEFSINKFFTSHLRSW